MTDNFIHIFKKGTKNITFCLFHGTGGDENDLLPIAEMIDPDANYLGIRGNVTEHGMNRFFKRIAGGIFDEADIIFQSGQIVKFLKDAEKKYKFDLQKTIFVGYSNGANIVSSIVLLHPEIVPRAILFRPMIPLVPAVKPNLTDHSALILVGEHDTVIVAQDTEKLLKLFISYKANIEAVWLDAGHGLTPEDIEKATEWYKKTI